MELTAPIANQQAERMEIERAVNHGDARYTDEIIVEWEEELAIFMSPARNTRPNGRADRVHDGGGGGRNPGHRRD